MLAEIKFASWLRFAFLYKYFYIPYLPNCNPKHFVMNDKSALALVSDGTHLFEPMLIRFPGAPPQVSIGSSSGVARSRWQAIIWSNAGWVSPNNMSDVLNDLV